MIRPIINEGIARTRAKRSGEDRETTTVAAIGERAVRVLRERFAAALGAHLKGRDQVEAIGRAHMGYAHEFSHYFYLCSRYRAHSTTADASSNEGACLIGGDQAIGTLVQAIETGIADDSIRANIGSPLTLTITLWAFTHGIIQLAMAKGADQGVPLNTLSGAAGSSTLRIERR